MRFHKEKYKRKELAGDVTNRMEVSINMANSLLMVDGLLQYCLRCGFPLLEPYCRYCHQYNPDNWANSFMDDEFKNWRKEPVTSGPACDQGSYILLIDVSGSTKFTYKAPASYKQPPVKKVAEALGAEVYRHLRAIIPEEQLLLDLDFYVKESKHRKRTNVQIIQDYCRTQGFSPLDCSLQTKEKYISRKQIIEYAVRLFLDALSVREPQATVVPIFFNDMLTVPSHDFSQLFSVDVNRPSLSDLYELGKSYCNHYNAPIILAKESVLECVLKMPAGGQTATGPALAFSCGLASKMTSPVRSIILMTDGIPNVGFGNFDEGQVNLKDYYEELALRFAIPSSCIINIVGFSDDRFGQSQFEMMVKRTCGICHSIDIRADAKGDKLITMESLEGLCQELENLIGMASMVCYQTRLACLVENEKMCLTMTDRKLQEDRTQGLNCMIGWRPGIVLVSHPFEVSFTGSLPDSCKGLRFSVIADFHYNGKRNVFVSTKQIELEHGTKDQVEKVYVKFIEEKIKLIQQKTSANQNDFDNIEELIKRNQHFCRGTAAAKLYRDLHQLKAKTNETVTRN